MEEILHSIKHQFDLHGVALVYYICARKFSASAPSDFQDVVFLELLLVGVTMAGSLVAWVGVCFPAVV